MESYEPNSSDAPALSEPEDLVALQRKQPKKRNRKRIDDERNALRSQRHSELSKQANKEHRKSAAWRFLRSKYLTAGILVLLVYGLGQALYDPINKALNPPLAASALERNENYLRLRAERALRATTKKAKPTVATTPMVFQLTYTVPRGTKMFNGRKTQRRCQVQLLVDRQKSQPTRLQVTIGQQTPCTP